MNKEIVIKINPKTPGTSWAYPLGNEIKGNIVLPANPRIKEIIIKLK